MVRSNSVTKPICRLVAAATLSYAFGIVMPPASMAKPPPWGLDNWFIEEFQPNIVSGGRANTIAVHPNGSIVFVASESGGLFKSDDGGKTWRHVDSLPVFYTNAVAFTPSDPKIVIVTANEDFSVANRGGIWRSEDGGKTWTQVLWLNKITNKMELPPQPPQVGERFSAYEISIAPDTGKIFVASNYGVLIGDPQGKNWDEPVVPFADLPAPANPRVISVLALPKTTQGCNGNAGGGNLVLAGGPSGVRRSPDGGNHWCVPASNPSPTTIRDMHAFGRSPSGDNHALLAAEAALDKDQKLFIKLYSTQDGGNNWTFIFAPDASHTSAPENTCRPNGGCCGGIAFARAATGFKSLHLYLSNRCHIWRSLDNGKTWGQLFQWGTTSEAGDTRDMAFEGSKPVLVASDNGLAGPPVAGSTKWTLVGPEKNGKRGNGPNGFNALQIYELKGQWVTNLARHNLYFGTQDNALWSSGDMGKNWTWCCNEGRFFEGEYRVAKTSDSQITFNASGNKQLLGLLFSDSGVPTGQANGTKSWPNPPLETSGVVSTPKILRKNFHVQGVESLKSIEPWKLKLSMKKGLAVTYDAGQTWQQYAIIDEDRRDLPKLSWSIQKKVPILSQPVLYQAIRINGWNNKVGEILHLARIDRKPFASDGSVTYPDMTGLGGLGIALGRYAVFAVDPANGDHLIAADVINEKMMETWDGAKTWNEMPQLTSLVTGAGLLNFAGRAFTSPMLSNPISPYSQVSVISFSPESPNMVAVGTMQNGIFISVDSGKDQGWTKVPGSERATLISSLHWRKADDIIVSTYGRGIFRVRFNYLVAIDSFPCTSPDCLHVYVKRPPQESPSPYDHAIHAFGGGIQGARIVDGIVQEIFVWPGTSVAFAADRGKTPDIKVSETTRQVGFIGLKSVPRPPRGSSSTAMTGLTLRKVASGSELVGVLFGRTPSIMYAAEEAPQREQIPAGPRLSPTSGKPYLELLSGQRTSPGRTVEMRGRSFERGSTIDIAVDGVPSHRAIVGRDGKFSASVRAPSEFGLHALTVVDQANGRVLDGVMIAVNPDDALRKQGKRVGP